MENYRTITGTYGSGKTPCDIFICETHNGTWYCVEGSKNVNKTYEDLGNGVDVEYVSDFDFFTASKDIDSIEELEEQINR